MFYYRKLDYIAFELFLLLKQEVHTLILFVAPFTTALTDCKFGSCV